MTDQNSATTPDAATKAEEEIEARREHESDRPPTAEEEQAAPASASKETEKGYQEMGRLGAEVEGEGKLP